MCLTMLTVSTGDCLLDVPDSAMSLPRGLPGATYSLDQQCQQVFGEEFLHCPNMSDSAACSQLWCQEDGTLQCSTRNGSLPWADGTPCGPDGTCLHGACTPTREVMQPLVRGEKNASFFFCATAADVKDVSAANTLACGGVAPGAC